MGVVLLLEILRDLIAGGVAPGGVDFGTGENLLKARLSNQSTQEAYYYLFPRTARGAALGAALGAANGLSALGGKIVSRWRGGEVAGTPGNKDLGAEPVPLEAR